MYFPDQKPGRPEGRHFMSQAFPYTVRDVYGFKVIPESLGDVVTAPEAGLARHTPREIVDAARRQLVVRDNVAGFFFHPFLDVSYLNTIIHGLQESGYTFVAPDSL